MELKLENALAAFNTADECDLDCGVFDIRIRPAATHNPLFRAAIAKRGLSAKKRKLTPDRGTVTGNFEEDVELFIEAVIMGWGARPLKDDDGNTVEYSADVARAMFLTGPGRKLFDKIIRAAVDDDVFEITEEDEKKS